MRKKERKKERKWTSRLGLQKTPTASMQWGKTPPSSALDKQTHGEALVMLELWEMQSNPSVASFPGPLWPGVVAPHWVLSMG